MDNEQALAVEGTTHPPLADKVIMIDFDGTILPWGALMELDRAPYPGVRNAINTLVGEGFTIGIFTSRLSPTWMAAAGTNEEEQRTYIDRVLRKHGITYHFATAEKLPAEAYFDDKAYHVGEGSLASTLAVWRFGRE